MTWTAEDVRIAAKTFWRARAQGLNRMDSIRKAAEACGKARSTVQARYKDYGSSFRNLKIEAQGDRRESRHGPPDTVLAERDRNYAAMDRMSLGARLMGDPPPGRSALDRAPLLARHGRGG